MRGGRRSAGLSPRGGQLPAGSPPHLGFLANNLLWACSSYEPVGQDIAELRSLHGEMTALAAGEKRAGRVPTGLCPAPVDDGHCGQPAHRVHSQPPHPLHGMRGTVGDAGGVAATPGRAGGRWPRSSGGRSKMLRLRRDVRAP
jgi:hypothetical protein